MAQSITLQTSDDVITSGDVIGRLAFAASNENSGSDAILIGGSIYAVAENEFTEISNKTSIIFATANSESASPKLKITSTGDLYPVLTRVYDIGGPSNEFQRAYVYDTFYLNGTVFIDRQTQTFGADGYALASGVIIDGGTP